MFRGETKRKALYEMDSDEVEFLLSKGFSKSKVTEMLRVSHQTFYNKRSTLGQEHFSDLSDNDLDLKVRSIKSTQVIFCPREYECKLSAGFSTGVVMRKVGFSDSSV